MPGATLKPNIINPGKDCLSNFFHTIASWAIFAWVDNVRFESGTRHVDSVINHRLKKLCLNFNVYVYSLLQRVGSRQANIWLYNRHETLRLTDERISSQILHIRFDRKVCRACFFNINDKGGAPFGETSTAFVIFFGSYCKRIETLHDGISICAWELVDLKVRFNSRDDTTFFQDIRKQFSIIRFLVQCLGIQNCSTQIIFTSRGCK